MCLEDLRLGKGRRPDKPGSTTIAGNRVNILPPDASRVAVILSAGLATLPAVAPVNSIPLSVKWIFGDINGVTLTVQQNLDNSPVVLKIEEVGTLITGSIDVNGGTNYYNVDTNALPILSYVNAPAIER